MKTTMVAEERVWSPQGRGLRRPPDRLCLLCQGGRGPAVGWRGGCPWCSPAPSLRPHPHGRRMLGQAKRIQPGAARGQGRLGSGRRGQPRLRPPRSSLARRRRRAGAPPLASPLAPGSPASSHAQHGWQGSILLGSGPGFLQLSPLAPLGPPQDPPRLLPAGHSIPAKRLLSSTTVWSTGRNWEAFTLVRTSPWDTGTGQPAVLALPLLVCPQHPPGPSTHRGLPSPARALRAQLSPQRGHRRHRRAKGIRP